MLVNHNSINTRRLSQIKQEELEALLKLEAEAEATEDLQIIQPDGSHACISYELAGQGFSLVPEKEMDKYSD